jgi:hypothetical protein
MSEFEGMVWIVECNHRPLMRGSRVVSFPCGGEGTNAMREYLHTLQASPAGKQNYYDAVIYESRAKISGRSRA